MGHCKKRILKNFSKKTSLALLICMLLIFTGETSSTADDKILDEVKQVLKTYYVDDLPKGIDSMTNISDLLKTINKTDPYTKYYSPSKYDELVNSIDNETSGLGIYIEMNSDGAKVISMNAITPERDAGLMVGDTILMADKHLLVGVSQSDALNYIKGDDDGIVTLKVKRGTNFLIISVNRQHTASYAIEAKILDNHIGYININSFSQYGGTQFAYIIKSFQKKKVDRYIIDLRYNSGGFTDTEREIAGYFIGANTAYITKGKFSGEQKVYAKYNGTILSKPIVFLVNDKTKSSAEILAAAVKDYRKAYIIGTKTFGKGSSQFSKTLSNNYVLKVTINKLFSPIYKKPIDKYGVSPDFVVESNVDPLVVAQLLMNSQKQLLDTKGCVRINFDDKSIVTKASNIMSDYYWEACGQLLKKAKKNGNVAFWNGFKWESVDLKGDVNFESIYFRNYDLIPTAINISPKEAVGVKFPWRIIGRSVNSKNFELIDSITGERVKCRYKYTYDRDKAIYEVDVSPVEDLKKNYAYYLAINPGILKQDNATIGKGMVEKYITNLY